MRLRLCCALLVPALLCVLVSPATAAQKERLRGTPGPGSQVELGGIVADPSFEDGTPNSFWDEESTNFGTPLCDEPSCGLGGGTGPNSGAWWAWFGGIAAFEEGAVSQMVTLPPGDSATLTFALEAPVCSGDSADFMEVTLNGFQVWSIQGDDVTLCNQIGYTQQVVNISPAAGQTVELRFHSVIHGAGGLLSNFFVDDVSIEVGGGADPVLTTGGSCPGQISVTLTGGTPNGGAGIIFSETAGNSRVPAGPCAGEVSGLSNPQLLRIVTLDGNGGFSISPNAKPGHCGLLLQVVDVESCNLSNVTSVPVP